MRNIIGTARQVLYRQNILLEITFSCPGLPLRAVTRNTLIVTAELSGCYWCCSSLLYIVLSVYSQIVTGVRTQVMAD